MKFVNFFHEGAVRTGLLGPAGVVDLAAADLWHGSAPVRIDDIEALRSKINPANLPARSLDSLHLAPAVIAPEKIICVGLNYRRHALEAGFPVPTTPVILGKFANSLAGSGTSVALPDVDTKYDFEAELGVIIGRAARNVPVEAALDYVAGYCCANDLSARGAQLATSQWMIGKMLDGFLPLGPYLVTADTVKDPQSLGIRCRVNGELGARVRTGGPRRGAEAPPQRPQAGMSSRLRLDLARLEIFGADDHGGAGARRGTAPADLGHGAFVPLTLPPRSSASLSRLLLDPVAALGDRDDPN